MTLYKIITAPDPILRTISSPVTVFDKALQTYLEDMLETMYHERGAGLASIQIGIPKRIMVIDIGSKTDPDAQDPHFFINPEIISSSEELKVYPEGCLSFPGGYLDIERPRSVKIRYLNYHGKEQELEATDWLSRAIQHEIDHLNGQVLIDHVSKLKSDLFMKKIIKIKRTKES